MALLCFKIVYSFPFATFFVYTTLNVNFIISINISKSLPHIQVLSFVFVIVSTSLFRT